MEAKTIDHIRLHSSALVSATSDLSAILKGVCQWGFADNIESDPGMEIKDSRNGLAAACLKITFNIIRDANQSLYLTLNANIQCP